MGVFRGWVLGAALLAVSACSSGSSGGSGGSGGQSGTGGGTGDAQVPGQGCAKAGGMCGCAGGCNPGYHPAPSPLLSDCPQPCDTCGGCSQECCLPDATDGGVDAGCQGSFSCLCGNAVCVNGQWQCEGSCADGG
ncbi:MAG: hypothetical protein R3B13_03940 [Polyangiaceae bacterium]